MLQGHTHVIRTTAAKLEADLDAWLNGPDATSSDYTCHHVGGRDWVIVLRHNQHETDAVHPKTPTPLLNTEEYEGATERSIAGFVEDGRSSWILYVDGQGRPVNMWLRRDTDGGVVGEPITFSGAQVDTIPGWDINMLRESRETNADPVDVPDWFIEVWSALADGRPIDLAGWAIPEWLDAFLRSSLANRTVAAGPAPIPLAELVTAGGRVDPDLPNKLIHAASEINVHGYKSSLPWADVAGLLSQAGTLLAWYSDRSTEGAPYWVKHRPATA